MPKVLCAALSVMMAGCGAAAAASDETPPAAQAPVVLAANGCGPAYFRTLTGECVPNRMIRVGPQRAVILPPPCPRGFLRDPDPARPVCYPIR